MPTEDEDKSRPSVRINVSVGREIDAALGDVIRSLLKRPSEEVGNLFADSIGLIGDKVSRKRSLNTQLVLESSGIELDRRGVSLDEIEPLPEEELYLLLDGVSLADDATVRELWAGLIASALDPDSELRAERAFISILRNISPTDARVLEFLGFVVATEAKLKSSSETFTPINWMKMSPEEEAEVDRVREVNSALQQQAIAAVNEKADHCQVRDLVGEEWSYNLLRLGLIEKVQHQPTKLPAQRLRLDNQEDLIRMVAQLSQQVKELEAVRTSNASPPDRVVGHSGPGLPVPMEVQLTKFGRRFMNACGAA